MTIGAPRSKRPRRRPSLTNIATTAVSFLTTPVHSIPACPQSHREVQPDGSYTPPLYLQGDHRVNYVTDAEGYAVVRDDSTGWHVYAEHDDGGNDEESRYRPSQRRVGSINPAKHNVLRLHNVVQSKSHEEKEKKQEDEPAHRQRLRRRRTSLIQDESSFMDGPVFPSTVLAPPVQQAPTNLANPPPSTGTLHNLVVLLRFADHTNRILPSQSDVEILYNQVGGDATLAPTGSIRDAYLENSYGQLTVETTVIDWITLSQPEAYYGNGDHGLTKLIDGIREALDVLEADATFNFADFDHSGGFNEGPNNIIDSLGVLTSSYGAEYGGSDCYGQLNTNRIWSHYGLLTWSSASESIAVDKFHVSSAMRGSCGSNLVRRGVLVHELGHVLGLPDLYDPTFAGRGIGSYDVMSNAWGTDGTGLNPPLMSAWSKAELGWVQPAIVTSNGQYTIGPSSQSNVVYKITEGYPAGEYLLIENRQDDPTNLLQPGLAIWHIDETAYAQRLRGFPDQDGWPFNGHHYRVALLQADGNYDLEMNGNSGDAGDLWHASGGSGAELGPGGSSNGPIYPNTDSYQNGIVQETGVIISIFSPSQDEMTFQVLGLTNTAGASDAPTKIPTKVPTNNPTPSPTDAPTKRPTAFPTKRPTNTLTQRPTALPTRGPTNIPTALPTRGPTKLPSASPPTDQQQATPTASPVQSMPYDAVCPPDYVGAVPLAGCTGFKYCSDGVQLGNDVICVQGTLFDPDRGYCDHEANVQCTVFQPGSTSSPVATPTSSPSKSPTRSPSKRPTEKPTTAAPTPLVITSVPTKTPTEEPTDAPTRSPTASPTKAAVTDVPTNKPSTDVPTMNPTETPTASPTASGESAPSPTPPPVEATTKDCPVGFTGHVALDGCRGFYYCSDGTVLGNDVLCIENTLFDATRGYCARSEEVECDHSAIVLDTLMPVAVMSDRPSLAPVVTTSDQPSDFISRSASSSGPSSLKSIEPSSKSTFSPTAEKAESSVPTPTATGIPSLDSNEAQSSNPSDRSITDDENDVEAVQEVCPAGFTGHMATIGCGAFYYCAYGVKTGNDIPCAPGTLYDATIGYCEWADKVECDNDSNRSGVDDASEEEEAAASPPPCPAGYTGNAANEGCTGYHYCSNGNRVGNDIMCPQGQLFATSRGYCDFKDQVVCATSPLLSPAAPSSSSSTGFSNVPTLSPTGAAAGAIPSDVVLVSSYSGNTEVPTLSPTTPRPAASASSNNVTVSSIQEKDAAEEGGENEAEAAIADDSSGADGRYAVWGCSLSMVSYSVSLVLLTLVVT